jgi:hypothetical protein
MIMVAVLVLLCFGCDNKGKEDNAGVQEETWPDVQCPRGGETTARIRLQEIMQLADAAGTPEALQAKAKAMVCRNEHTGTSDTHREKVVAAHNAARAQNWTACVSELTHGNDGGGVER